MRYPIILDLETKHSFREVGKDLRKLGVSCVGIYDYATDTFASFLENELDRLFPRLEAASGIIGFNINRFDLPVLNVYYPGNLANFPTLDLLETIKLQYGKRIALDELAKETLGVHKSGHGLLAIEYYRERKFSRLREYCLDDVKITRDLYMYGKQNGKVYFRGPRGREVVRVNWQGYNSGQNKEVNLTLGI